MGISIIAKTPLFMWDKCGSIIQSRLMIKHIWPKWSEMFNKNKITHSKILIFLFNQSKIDIKFWCRENLAIQIALYEHLRCLLCLNHTHYTLWYISCEQQAAAPATWQQVYHFIRVAKNILPQYIYCGLNLNWIKRKVLCSLYVVASVAITI